VQFTYEADEATKTVSLEVVWNSDFIVDDNYGITRKISSFSFYNLRTVNISNLTMAIRRFFQWQAALLKLSTRSMVTQFLRA